MLNMYAPFDQAHLVKKQPAKAKQPATTKHVIFYLKNSKKDTCTEYRAAQRGPLRYGAHTVHS
jgi:hypothetical protein